VIDFPDFFAPRDEKNEAVRSAIGDATAAFTRKYDENGIGTLTGFGDWLKQARSQFDWTYRHFRVMQDALDLVTLGELRRVLFQVPIRHGKTEHNSIAYAAYRLEKDPSFRWIVASYSQKQAEKISRAIRKLARERGVKLNEERNSAGEWETMQGGGVRAVGSGAGVAGVNADGIIIDDPIGSRADAESEAGRNHVYDWITNDLLARCEPHTFVLFTMSRWHTDDPAGRLLTMQAGLWHVVDMPGRCEDPEKDILHRKRDEVLWPEFRNEQWHKEARVQLGEYGYASLIQGRPRPREGGMFKWDWWRIIKDVPVEGMMIRYVDMAGTDKKKDQRSHDPDYTAASLLCRMISQETCIVDVRRFRYSVHRRDAELIKLAREDLERYGYRVTWWIEAEVGIAGEDRTRDLVKNLQALGLTVYTEHPTGNKALRAEPLASACEAQNILIVEAGWNDEFRMEAADFPNGTHDDMVDSAAGAYAKLGVPISGVSFTSLTV